MCLSDVCVVPPSEAGQISVGGIGTSLTLPVSNGLGTAGGGLNVSVETGGSNLAGATSVTSGGGGGERLAFSTAHGAVLLAPLPTQPPTQPVDSVPVAGQTVQQVSQAPLTRSRRAVLSAPI